jgi:hypothetical protein
MPENIILGYEVQFLKHTAFLLKEMELYASKSQQTTVTNFE